MFVIFGGSPALMPSFYALAAPVALLLPMLGQIDPAPASSSGQFGTQIGGQCNALGSDYEQPPHLENDPKTVAPISTGTTPLSALRDEQVVRQVRIERRVIIRISPQRSSNSGSLLARLPQRSLTTRFEEREMDTCVPVSSIAGVQTGSGSRLILYLDDKRIVSANLEKSCRARDFYSGFYVERNKDGKICVARDKLQSRTGAKCEVARMRQLVSVSE